MTRLAERYMGDGAYCYIDFNEKTQKYEVSETAMYGGNEQFVAEFDTFEEANVCQLNLA